MKSQVAARRDAGEVLVELEQRRAGEAARHGARVLDGAGALEQRRGPMPRPAGERAARGRAEERVQLAALVAARVAQGVDDHQRALALEQIAVDLLAVRRARFEVQQVVLDLERGAEEEAQA